MKAPGFRSALGIVVLCTGLPACRSAHLPADAATRVSLDVRVALREACEKKARQDGTALQEAMDWARFDAWFEVRQLVAERCEVTQDQVKWAWSERGEAALSESQYSYQGGTFVLGQTGLSRYAVGEKLPGAEEWWRLASSRERTSFLLAYLAEHSSVFQVVRVSMQNCPMCYGAGVLELYAAGEEGSDAPSAVLPCPRCKSLSYDRIVRFR